MNRMIVSGLALLTAASMAACQRTPASDKAAEELKAEKEKTAASSRGSLIWRPGPPRYRPPA